MSEAGGRPDEPARVKATAETLNRSILQTLEMHKAWLAKNGAGQKADFSRADLANLDFSNLDLNGC